MQTGKIFTSDYRLKLTLGAAIALLLGGGMFFYPYVIFGYLVGVLPWCLLVLGAFFALNALRCRQRRKSYFPAALLALILLGDGALLLWRPAWCDTALWYIFAGYLLVSAWQVLLPARKPGVEKQTLWRYAGAISVWGFVALMLCKPRSGLSEALMLLGVFLVCWGIFQLLLPSPQE